jgi:hypothetical protein
MNRPGLLRDFSGTLCTKSRGTNAPQMMGLPERPGLPGLLSRYTRSNEKNSLYIYTHDPSPGCHGRSGSGASADGYGPGSRPDRPGEVLGKSRGLAPQKMAS